MKSLAALAILAAPLAGCAVADVWPDDDWFAYRSTYQRVAARAERGDAESQNAAGYMLYLGEGVSRDESRATLWFERAAAQGHDRARRNLAWIAAQPAQPKSASAQAFAPPPTRGALLYGRYCSGCHGLNGIAAYENSPSFAFGDRLDKPDASLLRSILYGIQEMPGWDDKLPEADLHAILAHVRSLPAAYHAGLGGSLAGRPDYVFLFGVMADRAR